MSCFELLVIYSLFVASIQALMRTSPSEEDQEALESVSVQATMVTMTMVYTGVCVCVGGGGGGDQLY